MYLLIFAGRYDFEGGNIHYKGNCIVWALKIETYLGPEMATSIASAIGDQKRAQAKSQKSPTLTMA